MSKKDQQPEFDLFDLLEDPYREIPGETPPVSAPEPTAATMTQAASDAAPDESLPDENLPDAAPASPTLSALELRQAALGFLAAQHPAGVAGYVPARFRKYQVAAAAFWTRDFGRIKQVVRTAIVEIYDHRDRCFADCAENRQLRDAIHALREEREKLEAEIRASEPHLADTDDLFSEFRTWHYERSNHPDYLKLRRRLEKLQHALYHGSRLERIRRAGVADLLYLAVPAGTLGEDEIAIGWGLIYIYPNGRIEVRREPETQYCESAARNHLALNIAAAAAGSVLFSAGVQLGGNGAVRFSRPPRRRPTLRQLIAPATTVISDQEQ